MGEQETGRSETNGPIVLLTDFGESDPFVGHMKGVIAGIAPEVHVIDLCHQVPPQNIIVAGMFLKGSWEFFPEGSIFVVVVDPGVGTDRKAIVLKAHNRCFVGPDNGCLHPVIRDDEKWEGVEIKNAGYMLPEVSTTFHGRDIFAPVAAHVANGVSLGEFGPAIHEVVPIDKPAPEIKGGEVHGRIIYIDHFGNAWTNITGRFLREIGWFDKAPKIVTRVASCKIIGLRQNYLTDHPNKPIALINSFDLVEVAWPGGSAKEKMRLWEGVWVDLELRE